MSIIILNEDRDPFGLWRKGPRSQQTKPEQNGMKAIRHMKTITKTALDLQMAAVPITAGVTAASVAGPIVQ